MGGGGGGGQNSSPSQELNCGCCGYVMCTLTMKLLVHTRFSVAYALNVD